MSEVSSLSEGEAYHYDSDSFEDEHEAMGGVAAPAPQPQPQLPQPQPGRRHSVCVPYFSAGAGAGAGAGDGGGGAARVGLMPDASPTSARNEYGEYGERGGWEAARPAGRAARRQSLGAVPYGRRAAAGTAAAPAAGVAALDASGEWAMDETLSSLGGVSSAEPSPQRAMAPGAPQRRGGRQPGSRARRPVIALADALRDEPLGEERGAYLDDSDAFEAESPARASSHTLPSPPRASQPRTPLKGARAIAAALRRPPRAAPRPGPRVPPRAAATLVRALAKRPRSAQPRLPGSAPAALVAAMQCAASHATLARAAADMDEALAAEEAAVEERRRTLAAAEGRKRLARALRCATAARRQAAAPPMPTGPQLVAQSIAEGRARAEAREAAVDVIRSARPPSAAVAADTPLVAQARAQLAAGREALRLAAEANPVTPEGAEAPSASEGESLAALLAWRQIAGEEILALRRPAEGGRWRDEAAGALRRSVSLRARAYAAGGSEG